MTQQLSTTPQSSELRQKLIDAQQETQLFFKELEPELETLAAQASKIKADGVKTKEQLKESSSIVNQIGKKQKEVEEKRKDVTRILDSVKTDWIERERALLAIVTEYKKELEQANNKFVADEDAKLKAEKKKIEDEKNQNIELNSLPAAIKHRHSVALTTEVSSIRTNFALAWAKLTMETFEERVDIMKKYTPKITYDKALKYLEFTPTFIQPEQVEAQVKKFFNFEQFSKEYTDAVLAIKNEYIAKIEEKREELKTQTQQELERKQTEAQENEINIKAKEIADIAKKEEAIKTETATIITNAEIVAQAKMQVLQKTPGRTKRVAYLDGKPIDWQTIVETYIEKNGTIELEFLLENLVKCGEPEIEGVSYQEIVKAVNRA